MLLESILAKILRVEEKRQLWTDIKSNLLSGWLALPACVNQSHIE